AAAANGRFQTAARPAIMQLPVGPDRSLPLSRCAMQSRSLPRALARLRFFCQAAALAVALVGGLVLLGWALDLAALKGGTGPAGMVARTPASALAFVLAGVALLCLASPSAGPAAGGLGLACAAAVLLVGLLRVAGYLTGLDPGVDRLLFAGDLGD